MHEQKNDTNRMGKSAHMHRYSKHKLTTDLYFKKHEH